MRKFLRNMAKAKMKEMGYSKVNKRMDRGRWREIVGAYPVNLFTGEKMSVNFRGRKKNKPGSRLLSRAGSNYIRRNAA